jgi:C4-dicarboxylate transporter DctM subunit
MIELILFGGMFALVALNMPIGFALGVASVAGMLYIGDLPMTLAAQRMVVALDSFPLLAAPLFMLTGELMTVGGSARRIVEFSSALVGHIRGSLAHVTVLSSMLFSGISGSATADTAAVGSLMIPAMIRKGYDPDFATAIQASAGTMGPIIPPSVLMVIFGYLSGVSVGALFLGGVIPGILIGLSLMLVTYLYTRTGGTVYRGDQAANLRHVVRTGIRALPALGLVLIIMAGILSGVFTPTEAAAVAVFYGLFVELVLYRELRVRDMAAILRRAAIVAAMVMFIVAISGLFGWVMTSEEIPQAFTRMLLSISPSVAVTLLLINVLVLIAGTSLESTATLLIITPILMPVVKDLGLDPVHFGVVLVVGLCIGMVTPPVAVTLFVACGLSGRSVTTVLRPLVPQLLIMIAVLLLITYVPSLVTFLPRLFN